MERELLSKWLPCLLKYAEALSAFKALLNKLSLEGHLLGIKKSPHS